jgi:hypothetical protein
MSDHLKFSQEFQNVGFHLQSVENKHDGFLGLTFAAGEHVIHKYVRDGEWQQVVMAAKEAERDLLLKAFERLRKEL